MSWQDNAACKGTAGTVDWFPTQQARGGRTRAFRQNIANALAICAGCSVRSECLASAEAHWGTGGIWAGVTEAQRRNPPRLPEPVSRCGTAAGYQRHIRLRQAGYAVTDPCAECRLAHAQAKVMRARWAV